MNLRFDGKTVLVAGGTGALGRAVSLAFLEEGAGVTVTYRNAAEYDVLVAAAGERRDRLRGLVADVTDEAGVRELIGTVAGRGRLDVLVNAVGGYAGGPKLWESDAGILERMLSLNLRSGFVLARAAVPVMLGQGSGAIVNVAARAALVQAAGTSAYAASKAAALALMNSLAAELKGTGVRVNSILPSIIDSEANRRAMPKADHSRWPTPEELARVILFLSSEDARLISGAAIPVYGEG
jgi:NAD(P)-dependent dehydrogenase (short-subunit alcohol dehydrogenase family)